MNPIDIKVIGNRIIVAGSVFIKQQSPINVENSIEEVNIVDTLFDHSYKRSVSVDSITTNVVLSLICFYKPIEVKDEILVGLYCYIYGNQVNTTQISMTGYNGNGHTSLYIYQSSLSAVCLNQSNDHFSNFCGPCYMRAYSRNRFIFLFNISNSDSASCFEINSRFVDISYGIFSGIKGKNHDLIRIISGANGKFTDSYFFNNEGTVTITDSTISCSRIYSDVSIPILGANIGIGTMNELIRVGEARFCKIYKPISNSFNANVLVLNTFSLFALVNYFFIFLNSSYVLQQPAANS